MFLNDSIGMVLFIQEQQNFKIDYSNILVEHLLWYSNKSNKLFQWIISNVHSITRSDVFI